MQQLKSALHSYCLSSRDESLILAQIRVHEYSRTPHFSTLDSRPSSLERLDLRDARIEFQESSRDCQLTFERYCRYANVILERSSALVKVTLVLMRTY